MSESGMRVRHGAARRKKANRPGGASVAARGLLALAALLTAGAAAHAQAVVDDIKVNLLMSNKMESLSTDTYVGFAQPTRPPFYLSTELESYLYIGTRCMPLTGALTQACVTLEDPDTKGLYDALGIDANDWVLKTQWFSQRRAANPVNGDSYFVANIQARTLGICSISAEANTCMLPFDVNGATPYVLMRQRQGEDSAVWMDNSWGGLYSPNGELVVDAQGVIYGLDLGPQGNGRVFKADQDGNVQTLAAFEGNTAGLRQWPSALVLGQDGWLYGAVAVRRGYPYADPSMALVPTDPDTPTGFLFRVDPVDPASYQVLHRFTLAEGEIAWEDGPGSTHYRGLPFVQASLVEGPDGYLYGGVGVGSCLTTRITRVTGLRDRTSPSPLCGGDVGAGLAVNQQPLLTISAPPMGADLRTYYDGPNLHGSLYRIRKDGSDFTVLHTFSQNDGSQPRGDMVLAGDGRIYGTTMSGGANRSDNNAYRTARGEDQYPLDDGELTYDGTMYRIDPAAIRVENGQVLASGFQHVYSFKGGIYASQDAFGRQPIGLTAAPDGRLYGATHSGGLPTSQLFMNGNKGTIYQVSLDGVGVDADVTLTVTPTGTVQEGGTITLSWASRGVSTCTGNGGSTGDGWAGSQQEANGELEFAPQGVGEFFYSLTCRSEDGSASVGSNLVRVFMRVPVETETDYEFNQGNGGSMAPGLLAAAGLMIGGVAALRMGGRRRRRHR